MTQYIGSTIKSVEKRFSNHMTLLRNGKHTNSGMQSVYDAGYSPTLIVLENIENITQQELLVVEQEYLDAFNAISCGSFFNKALAQGGIASHIDNNKPITLVKVSDDSQIDFESLKAASEYIKCDRSAVSHVLNGNDKSIKGYRVFPKGEVPKTFEKIYEPGEQVKVRVRLTNKETGSQHDFDSITEAAIFLGDIKRVGNICHVLRGRFKSTFGYTAEKL